MTQQRDILCPSAPPESAEAKVIGVVARPDGPEKIRWVEKPVKVTPELLDAASPASPSSIMRIAGKCSSNECVHFDGQDCGLATRLVQALDPVVAKPPPCNIRADCRWFAQEGVAACFRCPQVVTEVVEPDKRLADAARPVPASDS